MASPAPAFLLGRRAHGSVSRKLILCTKLLEERLGGSRKTCLGAGIFRAPGGGNCLQLRGTRQITSPVDLTRLPNMWEKKKVRRKKVRMSRYEQKESDKGWHPELCVYETEFAKHEALYFYNLFAMPWEKGSWERFVDKLERKYFPDDLIDFEIDPDAQKTTKDDGKAKVAGGEDSEGSSKLGAEEDRRFTVEMAESAKRPKPKTKRTVQADQVDAAAEMFSTRSEAHHAAPSPVVDAATEVDDWQPITSSTKEKVSEDGNRMEAKPLLLKRNMELPKAWDGPSGTVILMDKPAGWTSFDVCGKLRKLLKVEKVGHAGTLDPLATGLLVVCIGKATKLADSYQAMTKVYSGTLRLGEATASYDSDTPVSEELPWEHITDEDVGRARDEFVGDIMQVPPVYSALKIEGERLYKKARRGEEFRVPPRMVSVYELHLERSPSNRQEFHFRVACSKGTYIRSLCYDLGRALNTCAHLTSLRRDKIGHMSVEDAWRVAELTEKYSREFI